MDETRTRNFQRDRSILKKNSPLKISNINELCHNRHFRRYLDIALLRLPRFMPTGFANRSISGSELFVIQLTFHLFFVIQLTFYFMTRITLLFENIIVVNYIR